ncbi:hypothetical protein [Streptomyces cyaneofuscatus]|uniref:hypothetical protein n=1 Tax=Streptomyces cyaneofuscatus TaxID=66883 RepID=UPI0037F4A1FA
MPRLQVLQLPEGTGEDSPPFVLVIDQIPVGSPLHMRAAGDRDLSCSMAARTGARTTLLFQDTIDIPANQEGQR